LRTSAARRAFAALLILIAAAGFPQPSGALDLSRLWPFGAKESRQAVPDATPYKLSFVVTGADRGLERKLRSASVLYGQRKTPPSGLVGLLARARQETTRLTAVLYENARYGGEVEITIAGRPLAEIGPFDPIGARPVPVTVRVTVGPAFVLGAIHVATLPPGMDVADDLGLVSGEPAGSAKILAAEAKVADAWRDLGHPLVRVNPRDIAADHNAHTVDVTLSIEPGPVADFGRVEVKGTSRVNPNLVAARAGLDGKLYRLKTTRAAETRLRDLGVFDSVRVTPADHLDADGTIPMLIEVSERKPRVFGAGVSYSNTEGLGVNVFWAHRNLFGNAEQLRIDLEVSRIFDTGLADSDYRLAGKFQKPAVFGPMTDLALSAETFRKTSSSYRTTAIAGEAGLTRHFSDTLTGGVSLGIERSWIRDAIVDEDHLLTTLTGTLEWDRRDNRLDPTEGFRALLTGTANYDFLTRNPFATFRADYSTYRALDRARRFVLAARVSGAVIAAGDIMDVPADRRLYAGGAGSVRGYAYQNIGPRVGDKVIGGKSLFEASVELRYRINDQFGVAAFVDAGNAYASTLPHLGDLKFGAGVGLRYLTPVGPLRLDVAVPLKREAGDPRFGLYVGLGQSF